MIELGDIAKNEILSFTFPTYATTSQSITPSVLGSIVVYKDSNIAESSNGITLTHDFDGRTGLHHVQINTTDAFYTTGSDYSVVYVGATVDTVTPINAPVAHFSIDNRHAGSIGGIATLLNQMGAITGSADNTLLGLVRSLGRSDVTAPSDMGGTFNPANDSQEAIGDKTALNSTVALDATVAKDATVALDATVAKAATVALDATVAKEATLSGKSSQVSVDNVKTDTANTLTTGGPGPWTTGTGAGATESMSAGSPSNWVIPELGNPISPFTVILFFRDNTGQPANADVTPTLTAETFDGSSRDANWAGAITNPATGEYRRTYNVADTHAVEEVIFRGEGAVNAVNLLAADITGMIVSLDIVDANIVSVTNTGVTDVTDFRATDANIKAQADQALTDIHLDHLLAVATAAFPGNAASILGEMLERITTWRYVTEALSQAAGGGDASSANQTEILDRIGSFSKTGVNNILGFFQALARSDATVPADMGGSFVAGDDSQQAIGDKTALDSTAAKEGTLNLKIPTNLAFTGLNVNANVQVNSDKTGYDLNNNQTTVNFGTVLDIVNTQGVNVIQWLSAALTDNLLAGQAAANISKFFEVNPTTTKTVNDVGVAGSGLTKQDVADAMRINPTGTVEAGSVDDKVSQDLVNSDRVDALLENVGGDRYTAKALEQGGGGGAADWSDPEKNQIRDALGVDGTKTAATSGQLQNKNEIAPDNATVGDTNTKVTSIQGKMPTNFVMGSADQTNYNDEIIAINSKTTNLPTQPANEVSVQQIISTGGGGPWTTGTGAGATESMTVGSPTNWFKPETGTNSFKVLMFFRDNTGQPADADVTPTLTAEAFDGSSRDGNWAGPLSNPSTGEYVRIYNVASSHDNEEIIFRGAGTVNAVSLVAADVTAIGTSLEIVDANVIQVTAVPVASVTDFHAPDANIKQQIDDALTVDTHPELSGVPLATSTIIDKLNWLFAKARNKISQNVSQQLLRNDTDTANIGSATTTNDGTTTTREEWQ